MDFETYSILNKKIKEAGGVPGQDGITPNITIGTVTTLEPGENATVENVGTKEEPVFNFGIPRGQDGTGGSELRLIKKITLEEEVNAVEISLDENNEPFELEELYIKMNIKATTTNDADMNGVITINTSIPKYFTNYLCNQIKGLMRKTYDAKVFIKAQLLDDWEAFHVIRNTVNSGSNSLLINNGMLGNEKCKSIVIGDYSANTDGYFGVGTTIQIWGR